MDAMTEGRNIVVEESVSLRLLGNLIELQSAWNKWLPDIFSIIDVKVESVRESKIPVSGAICAFSGGIDSTFSAWRHSQGKNGYRSQNIKLCVLVHGFDIALQETAAFSNVAQKAITTLDDIGLKVMTIKTNYREVSCANWGYAHGTALVATLANFKSIAGSCLIGSSFPYNYIAIPWGSTTILDHLLSSDDFIVIHDGASHTRTEKVKAISEWKIGIENLHVCWQGDLRDRNCGKCEKCVRTKLNFLASGNPIPGCFDNDIDVMDQINKIIPENDDVRRAWKQIVEYANQHGIESAWVKEAKKTIKRKSIIGLIFPRGSFQRSVVKKIIIKNFVKTDCSTYNDFRNKHRGE